MGLLDELHIQWFFVMKEIHFRNAQSTIGTILSEFKL